MAYETKPAIYFAGKPGDLVRVYHVDPEESLSLGVLVGPSKERRYCWAVVMDNKIHHLHQDALEVCK